MASVVFCLENNPYTVKYSSIIINIFVCYASPCFLLWQLEQYHIHFIFYVPSTLSAHKRILLLLQ